MFTKPVVQVDGMGVVPSPAPVPRYLTHKPHAKLLANWLLFSARVKEVPVVHGRPFVLAKFALKLHVPWSSCPAP